MIKEVINENNQRIDETIPAVAKEWKALDKACDILSKSVYNLAKAVGKQDRKSANDLGGLWKYTYKNIEKFKELVSKEILSKLQ
tara:strand:+ start:251 stop:502 length:252 start_codon:yes stop_codon:yes gene_type:complete